MPIYGNRQILWLREFDKFQEAFRFPITVDRFQSIHSARCSSLEKTEQAKRQEERYLSQQ